MSNQRAWILTYVLTATFTGFLGGFTLIGNRTPALEVAITSGVARLMLVGAFTAAILFEGASDQVLAIV